jgi:hypothetical protein
MASRAATAEAALLKKLVKDELLKPRYRSDDPALVVEALMHEQGIASRLLNLLYQHRRSLEAEPKTSSAEQARALQSPGGPAAPASGGGACGSALRPDDQELDVITELQARWRKHVEASLRSLCSELGMPLMCPSASVSGGKPAAKSARALQMRGVYEPEEMLDVIAATVHPNKRADGQVWFGLVPLQLRTPTLAELVERLDDLNTTVRQVRRLGGAPFPPVPPCVSYSSASVNARFHGHRGCCRGAALPTGRCSFASAPQ